MKNILLAIVLVGQLSYLILHSLIPSGEGYGASVPVAVKPDQNRVSAASVDQPDRNVVQLLAFEKQLETNAVPTVPPGTAKKVRKSPSDRKVTAASTKMEDRFSTPEYLKVEWSRQRMATWRDYASFFADNNVSAQRIPALVELITTANASANLVRSLARLHRGQTAVPFSEEIDANDALSRQLGDDLYAKLKDYTSSIQPRRELGVYSDMLSSVGLDLSPSQQRSVLAVLATKPGSATGDATSSGRSSVEQNLSQHLTPMQLQVFWQFCDERSLFR